MTITTTEMRQGSGARLFVVSLASFMLLFFGLASTILTFWPVFANQLDTPVPYYSELPLAEDREEEFIDINSIPAKQLYPPLKTSLNDAAEGNWIRIPSIDVAVPLALSPSMNDADVLETLDLGAALYPNGIAPGELGNTFVSAHSTGQPWKGKYRFAFLKIDQVAPGNLVHLDYNGTRYTYRVSGKDIVTPSPDFRVASGRPVPTVTFMACWPLWTTDKRMLVRGELTNITKLTERPV